MHDRESDRLMDLLIIGGTRFVGRHLVEAAQARGDRVTLFNRGQSASPLAPLPADVTLLRGDRQGDLAALAEGRWDAVIDTCAYLPADANRMARQLANQVGHYALISSISAYASAALPNTEDAALGQIDDADTTVVDGRTYGPLKALCEAAVVKHMGPARSLLIRPGLVVGPFDPTQRFTWWPARLALAAADGLPVLAPGEAQRPLQFIDARDLAAFVLLALDAGASGAVNAVAPPGFTTMAGLLQACADAAGVAPRLHWIADAKLLTQGVKPWIDLPLWLPADAEHAAFMAVPTNRAQALGLAIRPLADTVAATLAWWRSLPAEAQAFKLAGLPAEREVSLLLASGSLG